MKKYPKVGILCPITHNFPPQSYGPWELVTYNLSESLVKMGVDVTVFATKTAHTSARLEYIVEEPLEHQDISDHAALTSIHIIHALKKSQSVDIIHNNLNIHPVLYAELIKTPMITTLHGAASEKNNYKYYQQLENKNYISLSYAERKFYPGLNYIDNVYNGVDFDRYTEKSNKNLYLVFSGRIVKEKGILSAIEVAKKTKIPLKIAGIITDQKFYDECVRPDVDGKLVQYVGALNYSDLSGLLIDALALVLMAEWNDPCPLSVIDAIASGVPVIGSTMGSLPELIYDKNLGIIVQNIDEACARIGELYLIQSSKCRQLARDRFSREKMAADYLENYIKFA
jgi:glycosyltransferase involved in cell wall biosynthesis